MRTAYLIMINGNRNNNKYYNMIDNGDGTWTAEYGRIGKSGQSKVYNEWDWSKKYYEKLDKGYEDVTDLQTAEAVEVSNDIENEEVRDLINKLTSYSSDFIKKNYSVGVGAVTPAMVERVQGIIEMMKSDTTVRAFNWHMEAILTTIPRCTDKVETLLAKEQKDFADILEREQSILNVMQSEVKAKEVAVGGKDMLKAHGLTIKPVTKKQEIEILDHLDDNTRKHFKRAFKVTNRNTAKAFKDNLKENNYADEDVKYLYHGSRNQNWLGILQQGLTLNNKAPKTGKMFGFGLYFGKSYKSYNYLSLPGAYWNGERSNTGYMAVFKMAIKNPRHVDSATPDMSAEKIKKMGFDGTYAHKGNQLRADEWIVYRENQVDIEYLIELSV